MRLRVGQLDALAQIYILAQPDIVVLLAQEREGQTFDIAGLGKLLPDQVCEFVDGLVRANCVVFGEDAINVIETIANTDVLNHVARV